MDQIRVGRISALNYTNGTARVVYSDRDNAVTAELPLLSSEYYMPRVDDLVMVLHLPNGAEAGLILGQFWCDGNRPPESGAGLYRKDLDRAGGCTIRHQEGGPLQIICSAGVEIVGSVTVSGDLTAQGKSLPNHTHTDSTGGGTSKPK